MRRQYAKWHYLCKTLLPSSKPLSLHMQMIINLAVDWQSHWNNWLSPVGAEGPLSH